MVTRGDKRTSGRSQPASPAYMVSTKTPYLKQGRARNNTQGGSVALAHALWHCVHPHPYAQTEISILVQNPLATANSVRSCDSKMSNETCPSSCFCFCFYQLSADFPPRIHPSHFKMLYQQPKLEIRIIGKIIPT